MVGWLAGWLNQCSNKNNHNIVNIIIDFYLISLEWSVTVISAIVVWKAQSQSHNAGPLLTANSTCVIKSL